MKAEDNTHLTEGRLRNRYVLVRKRIVKRTLFLNKNKTKMDPRRLARWEAAINRDIKEMELLEKWIVIAQKRGVFIYFSRPKKTPA